MKQLRLLAFLLRNSRAIVLATVGAGLLAGLFSAALLAVINQSLHRHDGGSATMLILAFLALASGKIVAVTFSQLLLVKFSQGTILELSLTLCRRMLNAPLRVLERHGEGRILSTLTDDVSAVTWAVQSLPQLAMNLAVVIGCCLYLAWLSLPMCLSAVGVTLLGAAVFKLLHARAFVSIHEARNARSRLFGHFSDLTSGLKNLMLHSGRREEFVNNALRETADEYRRHNLDATRRYAWAEAWVQTMYHGVIGLVLFAFPHYLETAAETLTGYAFAMLYMMSPLWAVIGAFPAVARGQVALGKIEELDVKIDAPPPPPEQPTPAGGACRSIELRKVVFSYDAPPQQGRFTLGPLDFQLNSGELVFVIGGNGSGKTTFAKLLTGLYWPQQGDLCLDGTTLGPECAMQYRELFSAVFTDFHLFGKLYGMDGANLQTDAREYLRLLQLDQKVDIRDRILSTLDLSQGQRKRLALLTAYLEDRPFYLFDEWAADQDPQYKLIFYSRLLPELRERGKGVVVITHDDRHFHLGDRIIRLEDGVVASADPDGLPRATKSV